MRPVAAHTRGRLSNFSDDRFAKAEIPAGHIRIYLVHASPNSKQHLIPLRSIRARVLLNPFLHLNLQVTNARTDFIEAYLRTSKTDTLPQKRRSPQDEGHHRDVRIPH